MPQYVFYPESSDGLPVSIEVFELVGDAQAFVCAERVMAEHRSSRSVAVWLEDRLVLTLFRPARPARVAATLAEGTLQPA